MAKPVGVRTVEGVLASGESKPVNFRACNGTDDLHAKILHNDTQYILNVHRRTGRGRYAAHAHTHT